jgi:hypothetical protein
MVGKRTAQRWAIWVYCVTVDGSGKVAANGVITTAAGNGVQGSSGDGGPATSAQLNSTYTYGIGVDGSGNLFIVDNQRIRKVSPNGTIATVAGIGIYCSFVDRGPANIAAISPSNVTVDSAGNLFITDTNFGVL